MSVPVGERKESLTQFLTTAVDIETNFIDLRIHKPKRYYFFIDKLLDLACLILTEAKAGNSIYPETQGEVELRLKHFKEALAYCQALISQVSVIYNKFHDDGLPIGLVQKTASLIEYEIKLLKGVISKDKERYKNLPQHRG